jgi:hypothetical protein
LGQRFGIPIIAHLNSGLITGAIIGCAFEVLNELGSGFPISETLGFNTNVSPERKPIP